MPLTPRETPAPILYIPRPSTWLFWHDQWIRRGARVLDLACGEGRHALLSAQRGGTVTAVDRDASKLDTAKGGGVATGRHGGLAARWISKGSGPTSASFDVVLVFNYLDRQRMPQIRDLVAPGGLLIMETFLDRPAGPRLGADERGSSAPARANCPRWSDRSDPVHGREVLEPVDAEPAAGRGERRRPAPLTRRIIHGAADSRPGRRAAIVAGLRTPFAKSGTVFRDVTAVPLARHAARELLLRTSSTAARWTRSIFGQVVPSVLVPNVAREVSLLPQLLPDRPRLLAQPGLRLRRPRRISQRAPTRSRWATPTWCSRAGSSRCPTFRSCTRSGFSQILVEASKAKSPGAAPRRPRADPPARPGAGHARHRRALDRRDDGAVGREDGQGERHHPRGAGPAGAA